MNYEQVIDYLYSSLPMFHRVGAAALKPGLDNTIALCKAVGDPQRRIKTVHIAGTNGKGSSSHMLAAILQSAGYKTGLYTSPHLKNFTERIKIDGQEISRSYVTDFVIQYRPVFESVKPSFFEMTVAMAFKFFEQEEVDIAVIEVGLGGRLDSTNIISPEACLITNISMDHQAILGDTLLKIASEKAGIIKQSTPVVIGETQDELVTYFQHVAKEKNAPIHFADQLLQMGRKEFQNEKILLDILKDNQIFLKDVSSELMGKYQLKNILGVVSLCLELKQRGWSISHEHIKNGLANISSLTGLKGRWQTLNASPRVICDVAHNEAGISELVAQVATMKYARLFWVLGVANDKDVNKILKLLPKEAYYYFCQAQIPRALDAQVLLGNALDHQLIGMAIPDVQTALHYAIEQATEQDLILVGGSNFVVAEVV